MQPLAEWWRTRFLPPSMVCALLLGAVTVQSAAGSQSDRSVEDGVLISTREPTLAMSVDDEFDYIGRHAIAIDDMAAGERFVYVDADDKTIRRLLIVQFEGFLPGIDETYRYNLEGRPVVAGYPFRSNGYAFDFIASVAENPTRESGATHGFLQELGLTAPTEWMMWRSLTVTDEARKKEAIIFYVEDVASMGLTVEDLYANDRATQTWIDIQRELEVRANRSFRLTTLNSAGEPDPAGWEPIPNTFEH